MFITAHLFQKVCAKGILTDDLSILRVPFHLLYLLLLFLKGFAHRALFPHILEVIIILLQVHALHLKLELVELILSYQTNLLRVKVHCTQLLGLRQLATLRAIGLALLTLAVLVLWVRSDKLSFNLWILSLVLPV